MSTDHGGVFQTGSLILCTNTISQTDGDLDIGHRVNVIYNNIDYIHIRYILAIGKKFNIIERLIGTI